MGWDWLEHRLTISRDSHGDERQERAIAVHRDLMAMLRLEIACFLQWRDPEHTLIRWVALDGSDVVYNPPLEPAPETPAKPDA